MAVASDSEKAEFSAKIPREMYDEFRRYFPGYGATTWFIVNSLNNFLELCRESPDTIERCQLAVSAMVQENRES